MPPAAPPRSSPADKITGFVPVIGLEVHAQLLTRTKMFCGCLNRFGDPPNTNVCQVCLGLPGALPVPNAAAIGLAIRMALAAGCTIHPVSIFARKNYFYPDLPKGYQISQYDRPLATGGGIAIEIGGETRRIGLTRIHLEEDAGKLVHEGLPTSNEASHVDFNRSGVPLIEIVGEPEIRSPEEAYHYLQRLRSMVTYLEVCDGNMEEGSLRCDANVSVSRPGEPWGTRVEIKNLNSFRNVQRALEHEAARQAEVLSGGGRVSKETRLWDADAGVTRPMRSKEEEQDYRYFPEPDLPPLVVDADQIERARRGLPELPGDRKARLIREAGLPEADAHLLSLEKPLADWFEAAAGAAAKAVDARSGETHAAAWRETGKWVVRDVLAAAKEAKLETREIPSRLPAARLAALVAARLRGEITATSAAEVFLAAWRDGREPADVIRERGLGVISDSGAIAALVTKALAENPKQVEQYRAGKAALLGFFVGQVMKAAGGQAAPDEVNRLVREALGGGEPSAK